MVDKNTLKHRFIANLVGAGIIVLGTPAESIVDGALDAFYAASIEIEPNPVGIDAVSMADLDDSLTKSSGDDQGAGDWTEAGDGLNYPGEDK